MQAKRSTCPGSGQKPEARHGDLYPCCPVCGRRFDVAGTRRSKAQARKGHPWRDGIPRHYTRPSTPTVPEDLRNYDADERERVLAGCSFSGSWKAL
jgi:hypothetical protein